MAYREYLKNRTLKSRTLRDYDRIVNDYLVGWKTKISLEFLCNKKYSKFTEKSPVQENMVMTILLSKFKTDLNSKS